MESTHTPLLSQEKVARARAGYDAFNAREFDKVLVQYSDDIVFHTPILPEPVRGKDAIRATMERITTVTDEYTLDPHDILANDDHLVVILMVHGRRGDMVVDMRGVHVAHLDYEGNVTELWAIADPAPLLALLAGT